MVEGARLESVYTGYRIEGSNPSLSAIKLISSRVLIIQNPAFLLYKFKKIGAEKAKEALCKKFLNSG